MQKPVACQILLQKIMTITFPFLMITTQTEKISHRRSKDNTLTSRGRQLNKLCLQMGLRILNDRFFGDSHKAVNVKHHGNFTVI
jgi:hypothetical protein